MKFKPGSVFKSLKKDLSSNHAFPIPGEWGSEASWVGPVSFEHKSLKPHSWGLHLAKADYLIYWMGERIFLAEYKGQSAETRDTVVSEYARAAKEFFFTKADVIDLGIAYCNIIKDLPTGLDFDWTITRTMQASFGVSKAFLQAAKKIDMPMPRKVAGLAGLCAWNSGLRHQDATSSVDYVYGCQAVAYASHALALLPALAGNDHTANLLTLKHIASDVRQAIALSVEQHDYRTAVNAIPATPLADIFAKWVRKMDHETNLSPKQKAFLAVGAWQNNLLLRKARVQP